MNFKVQLVKQLNGVSPSRLDTDTLGWLPFWPTNLKHRCLTSREWDKKKRTFEALRFHKGFNLWLLFLQFSSRQTKVVIWGHTLKLWGALIIAVLVKHSPSMVILILETGAQTFGWQYQLVLCPHECPAAPQQYLRKPQHHSQTLSTV